LHNKQSKRFNSADGHFAGQTKNPSKERRGNFVTFSRKTTVNKITNIISDMVKDEIVKEVKDAGMSSVQMDSTQ